MTPKQRYFKLIAETTIKSFAKRQIKAFYCEDKESAVQKALELMPEGSSARETPRIARTAPASIAQGTGFGRRERTDSLNECPVLALSAVTKPEKTKSTCPKSISAM